MGIKALRQAKADNDAKVAALKAEINTLLNVEFAARTAAQKARLTEGDTALTAALAESARIAGEIALAERAADVERNTPSQVAVGQNNQERQPWGPTVAADASPLAKSEARHAALGAFAMAVKAASTGGQMDPRLYAAATGAGTQQDASLGFALPREVAPGIERNMFESGKILSRVDARSISGNSISYNLFDETSRADGSRQGGVLGYWVDEGTAPTASMFKLARLELKLRKVGALGVMTDELIADAIGLGGELEASFERELVFQVENKIVRGNGSSAPLGFLNAPCLVSVSKESGQTAATINTENLRKMWARLPDSSEGNAVWLVNKETRSALDALFQPVGTAAIAPRFVNYGPSNVLSMFGAPVVTCEYPEAIGTVGDICLADLKQYRLIRKGGVEQASSMHVYFAQGEQAFRAFYRVDGQPVPRAAITPFKGSGTQSPFIVLQTRS